MCTRFTINFEIFNYEAYFYNRCISHRKYNVSKKNSKKITFFYPCFNLYEKYWINEKIA